MLFRDLKAADDVSKMKNLRKFAKEYTVYGCLFYKNAEKNYIVSSKKEKIIDFVTCRDNYSYNPLPIMDLMMSTTVPAGTEEDNLRFVKLTLAKKMRDAYDDDFLEGIRALSELENDDMGANLLYALQDQMYGLYQRETLLIFEDILNRLYRAKHLKLETLQVFEKWIEEEKHQLEKEPVATEQYQKTIHGVAYKVGAAVKAYSNANKSKVYEKKLALENQGTLVSAIFSKTYWSSFDVPMKEYKMQFEQKLEKVFQEQYFNILEQIYSLAPRISKKEYDRLRETHKSKNQYIQEALRLYGAYWMVND